jgi:hypothetical protein
MDCDEDLTNLRLHLVSKFIVCSSQWLLPIAQIIPCCDLTCISENQKQLVLLNNINNKQWIKPIQDINEGYKTFQSLSSNTWFTCNKEIWSYPTLDPSNNIYFAGQTYYLLLHALAGIQLHQSSRSHQAVCYFFQFFQKLQHEPVTSITFLFEQLVSFYFIKSLNYIYLPFEQIMLFWKIAVEKTLRYEDRLLPILALQDILGQRGYYVEESCLLNNHFLPLYASHTSVGLQIFFNHVKFLFEQIDFILMCISRSKTIEPLINNTDHKLRNLAYYERLSVFMLEIRHYLLLKIDPALSYLHNNNFDHNFLNHFYKIKFDIYREILQKYWIDVDFIIPSFFQNENLKIKLNQLKKHYAYSIKCSYYAQIQCLSAVYNNSFKTEAFITEMVTYINRKTLLEYSTEKAELYAYMGMLYDCIRFENPTESIRPIHFYQLAYQNFSIASNNQHFKLRFMQNLAETELLQNTNYLKIAYTNLYNVTNYYSEQKNCCDNMIKSCLNDLVSLSRRLVECKPLFQRVDSYYENQYSFSVLKQYPSFLNCLKYNLDKCV